MNYCRRESESGPVHLPMNVLTVRRVSAAWLQHEFSTVRVSGFVSLSFTTASEAHPLEEKLATKIVLVLPLTKFITKRQIVLEAHLSFQGLPSQVYTNYFSLEFSSQKEEERQFLYVLNIPVFIHYQGSSSDFKAQPPPNPEKVLNQKRKMSCYGSAEHLLIEIRGWFSIPFSTAFHLSAAKHVLCWVVPWLRPQWKRNRCLPGLNAQHQELLFTGPSPTAIGPPTRSLNGRCWMSPKYRKTPFSKPGRGMLLRFDTF